MIRLGLVYDIFMLALLVANLLSLGVDALLMGNVGEFLAHQAQEDAWLLHYRQAIHPVVLITDQWFTLILIAELSLRWLFSIISKRYHKWWWFPFIHWYEVLGCIPTFRALRLLRAVAIGYRLHQLGYTVVPQSWIKQGHFYYKVLLEEISDRIVVNVISGIEDELKSSDSHHHLIHDLVNRHRDQFNAALRETLQAGVAPILAKQSQDLQQHIGDAVERALSDLPELHRLLRLLPLVGGQIEQQVLLIGRRIGENLTAELTAPFAAMADTNELSNPALGLVADHLSEIPLDGQALENFVASVVFESLATIKTQVAVKQWQQVAEKDPTL